MTFDLLLADASPMMQRIVELTFAGSDVQVTAVQDGEEAVRRITMAPPDIVLADHALARRSGYEISAFVKGRAELAHIPVLLLAGAFEPVDQIRAAQVGCDGVIGKPFEPQQLTGRVQELLARERRLLVPQEPADPQAADGVELVPETGEVADIDAEVPTVSALLADGSRSDAPTVAATDRAETTAAPPEADGNEDAWRPPRSGHLTDLSELAEALGAFRRRTPDPPAPDPAPALPPQPSERPAPPAGASDELVDEVTRRVLERLAPGAVRDVASRVVSQVAERLLREELDRIRSMARTPRDVR